MLLPDRRNYEELRRTFRWEIPENFNIAHYTCDRWAASTPDRPAILHKRLDGTVHTITCVEFQRLANRVANLLTSHGIERGDRVAILLPQSPETALTHTAVHKLGGISLPLADLFGVEALEYRLNNAGVKALVTSKASLSKIQELRERTPLLEHVWSIDGADEAAADFHADLSAQSEEFDTAATSADDPALMIYTSGTTGPPKGALHAHRVIAGHLPCVQLSHDFFPQPGDCMWTPADWAWIGGLINVMLASLFLGVPVVAHRFEKFDPQQAYALMAELKVRNTFLPPTALKMLRAAGPIPGEHDVRLRTIFSGGEAVGRELQDWAQETFGIQINEVFGQTECNLVLGSSYVAGVYKKGSLGKPVPGHDVAIVGRNGEILPTGETGAIAVRRPDPVMFLKYWDRPEATREKFIGEWLITGDQGYRDEDGYYFFVGRDDDVITSAGYRIGPGEVEDCLLGHPAVKVAAVVGKPDPLRTEIVKAFVVLNDGHAPSDELATEIQAYVRDRLAAHEYPREVSFAHELPMTTTGKVIRRLLREKA